MAQEIVVKVAIKMSRFEGYIRKDTEEFIEIAVLSLYTEGPARSK